MAACLRSKQWLPALVGDMTVARSELWLSALVGDLLATVRALSEQWLPALVGYVAWMSACVVFFVQALLDWPSGPLHTNAYA